MDGRRPPVRCGSQGRMMRWRSPAHRPGMDHAAATDPLGRKCNQVPMFPPPPQTNMRSVTHMSKLRTRLTPPAKGPGRRLHPQSTLMRCCVARGPVNVFPNSKGLDSWPARDGVDIRPTPGARPHRNPLRPEARRTRIRRRRRHYTELGGLLRLKSTLSDPWPRARSPLPDQDNLPTYAGAPNPRIAPSPRARM